MFYKVDVSESTVKVTVAVSHDCVSVISAQGCVALPIFFTQKDDPCNRGGQPRSLPCLSGGLRGKRSGYFSGERENRVMQAAGTGRSDRSHRS